MVYASLPSLSEKATGGVGAKPATALFLDCKALNIGKRKTAVLICGGETTPHKTDLGSGLQAREKVVGLLTAFPATYTFLS